MAPINVAATGYWTAQQKNNYRQGRALLQGIYQNIDAVPLNGVRSGVLASVGQSSYADGLVTFVSGQQLAVAPFTGIAHRSGQGPYEGWLTSVVNPSVDTPPGANPRNDIVVMRWYDGTLGDTVPGGGANPCMVEVITGTPGAVPVDPVAPNTLGVITAGLPAGGGIAIPLARAQVAVGGAITLTDLRRSAAQLGSVRKLLPGDSDVLGSKGDLRMNGNILEIMNSSGTWSPMMDASSVAEIGGEYKASALQALTTGLNKLNFGTTVRAASGITWNGTNQFTVVTAGLYSITGSVYLPGSSSENCFAGTSSAGLNTGVHTHGVFATGGLSAATAGIRYLAAGTTVSLYCYLNSANVNTSFSTEPAEFNIWKVRGF